MFFNIYNITILGRYHNKILRVYCLLKLVKKNIYIYIDYFDVRAIEHF